MALAAGLLAASSVMALAQSEERCYGIARAGQDDGVEGGGAAGSSVVDFQGNAWMSVPAGSCMTTALPVQPDGTPRRGALQPLDRDLP